MQTGDTLTIYAIYAPGFGKTYAEIAGKPASRVELSRGPNSAKAPYEDFALVGKTASGVAIIRETYTTNANPNGMCGAGEQFELQVIATRPACKQTFLRELAGCADSTDLDGNDGVVWDAKKSLLSLHWLDNTKSTDERRQFSIAKNGTVTQVSSKSTPTTN
jgi:hypothetical protein